MVYFSGYKYENDIAWHDIMKTILVIIVGTARKGNEKNLQIFYGNVLIAFGASYRSYFQDLSNEEEFVASVHQFHYSF